MEACPRELALAHLLLRLRPLHRAMRVAVALRDAGARRLADAGAVPAAISRGHADALLDQLDALVDHRSISTGIAAPTPEELAAQGELQRRAEAAGTRLPLELFQQLGLDDFEVEVLVLCAAPEIDLDYERVVGFVQDDAGRRMVSVELACTLTAGSLRDRVARRAQLGPFGRLRRLGLIAVVPARENGLRDEIRLTPACTEAILGTPIDVPLVFHDPADVTFDAPTLLPADAGLLARVAGALRERRVDVVAVWGAPRTAREIVGVLSGESGLAIRRHPTSGIEVAVAAAAASALGTALWIDLDAIGEPTPPDLAAACRRTSVPLIITATQPWRPTELLAARRYVEVPVVEPDHHARAQLWRRATPNGDPALLDQIATAFHFDGVEVRAALGMAQSTAEVQTNGHVVAPDDVLAEACVAVARKHGERHTTMVTPRRGAQDLVLPPDLHARVLDLVHNFRVLPRVMTDWGFARRVSGAGIKALFTGEPGTGKTLAAEVVAKELGLPLLKVDLARVVSKWIGETEKHLDLVFTEAHDSHAVLFFDEAEALFGARGDVRHGTDRYANLEVSYLLQRLEDHDGVVVLATNLRDKIDPAFMRRFHAVLGFPRPSEKERRRMWQRVFTPEMPLAGDLDITMLARLDLTGAGIVGAAQTAALLAAREDTTVAMRHVVHGLVRQFQREARVLDRNELGPHAALFGAA